MDAKLIARYALLAVIVLFYLVRTFRYALVFRKDTYFTGKKKIFHSIMIWVVPFLWITMLKSFLTPTAGSASYRKRKFDSTGLNESGLGIMAWFGLGNSDGNNSGHHHGGDSGHHHGGDSFGGHSDGGGADSSSVD